MLLLHGSSSFFRAEQTYSSPVAGVQSTSVEERGSHVLDATESQGQSVWDVSLFPSKTKQDELLSPGTMKIEAEITNLCNRVLTTNMRNSTISPQHKFAQSYFKTTVSLKLQVKFYFK